MTQQALLEVSNLVREFPAGDSTVQILKDINLTIYEGELVAIVNLNEYFRLSGSTNQW